MIKQNNNIVVVCDLTNSAMLGLVKIGMTTRGDINAELYAKYNLPKDEIAFIESMIKPME